MKKSCAEFVGTFWLVLGGCGCAVLAGPAGAANVGPVGVALAFGLGLLSMGYAVGHISGGHFNPAVSVGLWAAGRLPTRDLLPYLLAQVLGGLAGGGALYLIASGQPGFDVAQGFAANGFGAHSPGGYALPAAALTELLLTALLVLVALGSNDYRAPDGMAPLATGLALALIHLVSLPVTNTSVNPARSTGVALYAGGWALQQLWLFWLAPLAGALLGASVYTLIGRRAR